jgi:hypothetical protein
LEEETIRRAHETAQLFSSFELQLVKLGSALMASCAKTLKRVTRELGMNDPAFICDDVNVDAVIASVPKRYELLTLQIGISSFLC